MNSTRSLLRMVVGRNLLRTLNSSKVSHDLFSTTQRQLLQHWQKQIMRQGYRCSSDLAGVAKEEPSKPLDEAEEKRRKLIEMEYELLKYSQPQIPESLTEEQWKELYTIPSASQRHKFLHYSFKVEKTKENRIKKKEEKKKTREQVKKEVEEKRRNNRHLHYGVGGNSLYYVIRNATIDRYHNQRLIRNMQMAQPLVIDMSFDRHMTRRERKNCAEQIMMAFGNNRMHEEPFHLHLCCAEEGSETMMHLNKFIPPLHEQTFPMSISSGSYVEMFPKDRLVYLTPDSRADLEWDPEAVYIMGGIVDKGNSEPLSLAKAKREGLKTARLPFIKFVEWGSGSGKRLTLDVMIKILLEVNFSGDWKKAFTHLPARKLHKDVSAARPRRVTNYW